MGRHDQALAKYILGMQHTTESRREYDTILLLYPDSSGQIRAPAETDWADELI